METLSTEIEFAMHPDPEVRSRTPILNENTFVQTLLDGSENGDFLALDLGGTNFRVLLCTMKDGRCTSTTNFYKLPNETLSGPSAGVFDHIADSIHKFLTEKNLLGETLPLGFTFSFPMVQESLKKGILRTWTKSFSCPDGVGEDAVKMLEDALFRKGDVNVNVVAILNDATGTLLAGSYLDHRCGIGMILGTGCNAAYVERVENVKKWQPNGNSRSPQVVIDIEWGAFGDNGSLDFIKTKYDAAVDAHSNHVGSYGFEKLFAGHYVGDLGRLIMLDLVQNGVLFTPEAESVLSQWGVFKAGHISAIEKGHETIVLDEIGLTHLATEQDLAIMRQISSMLTLRTAQVVSGALAVFIRRMQWQELTVAIDGSLYRYHPKLHEKITLWLEELCPLTQVKLIDAVDGSGKGAAFAAAVAVKQQSQSA
ncbi:hypothetical protein CAPTEDRAFT_151872 [Capitella teleta]|uniref:Phosphotransferase n=1 Tax=Capitella teleta TaxID=283909 RepID=R7USW3_CAPTE|nr:hypothetical protein CAPTEDRAFT_151872 [Capitella teleta]|eukprot:ELU09300.1 hypothetical protein CAPTEDRAFT_151872 [Capitella teleta]